MRFTVIGHACLLVEADGARLVIDPWLVGSCYWRSWWHHPPSRPDLVEPERVSAIYYTHEHPDHLHYPSLKRFPPTVGILVPRFPVSRIAPQFRARGYERIEEIPHAGFARVGPLRVYSYQYGLDDSVVVVTDGTTTLVNLNDAKSSGLALEQIRRRHAPADFLLRSHAPAQAYPFCYTAEDPRDLTLVGREYYTRSFAAAVRAFRPRYAVPFASNVRHLHPESRAQNAFMVPAAEVVEACRGRLDSTEVVRMDPGDAWDREKGFWRPGGRGAEPVTAAEAQPSGEEEAALARYMTEENAIAPADAAALGGYLETFLGSIPWPLRRAYPARVAFALGDGAHLVADVRRRRVSQVPEPPSDVHSIARINPRLLRDAVDKRCLNLVGISKRIEAHLKAGGLLYDAAFWGFLALYELEYLPMRRVLTPRAAAVLASRWREFLGYVRVFLRPSRSLETILDTWALE